VLETALRFCVCNVCLLLHTFLHAFVLLLSNGPAIEGLYIMYSITFEHTDGKEYQTYCFSNMDKLAIVDVLESCSCTYSVIEYDERDEYFDAQYGN
jgi:hypothetical protein